MQYRWVVLTVTTVGVLMSGIDSRIVVIGLPQVASALNADAEQAIWFTQAYVLGSTVMLLMVGRLSDIFGRVKIYNIGFVIFTIGSFLTSLSQFPLQLILSRFIQGIGSAVLFANSAAIITDATPLSELGLALGINQIAFRGGAFLGLTLSGLILTFLDWRALFYINVPIGIFGTVWAKMRLKEVKTEIRKEPVDIIGFVLFSAGVATLLLFLTYLAYGFFFWLSVSLGSVSFLLFVTFFFFERRIEYPALDFSLLSIRQFAGGIIAQFLNAVAWGAMMLLLSLYLQLVKGFSPISAGVGLLPLDLAFLASGPLSGRLSDKYGYFWFTIFGIILMSTSLLLLSSLTPTTDYLTFVFYIIIFGIGIGMFSSPNMSSIMSSVPARRRGVASALRATFFNVGFTLSFNVAILIMVFYAPYSVITKVISTSSVASLTNNERYSFSSALTSSFFWLGLINTLAIIPSALRARKTNK